MGVTGFYWFHLVFVSQILQTASNGHRFRNIRVPARRRPTTGSCYLVSAKKKANTNHLLGPLSCRTIIRVVVERQSKTAMKTFVFFWFLFGLFYFGHGRPLRESALGFMAPFDGLSLSGFRASGSWLFCFCFGWGV